MTASSLKSVAFALKKKLPIRVPNLCSDEEEHEHKHRHLAMYIILRAKKWLALEGKEGGKARRGVGVVTSRSVALLPNAHAPPGPCVFCLGLDDRRQGAGDELPGDELLSRSAMGILIKHASSAHLTLRDQGGEKELGGWNGKEREEKSAFSIQYSCAYLLSTDTPLSCFLYPRPVGRKRQSNQSQNNLRRG